MQCYEKNAKTKFNEDRKLQNDIYILMQFTQENSCARLCECMRKYREIDCKNACHTVNYTYLWIG